ncbi:hypothetical protein GGR51DRAFT_544669 [Nemania sp. FL0031]|nr:hypothetical protein GGR51DRAFT_544669 [Nemania sp. FL0031]
MSLVTPHGRDLAIWLSVFTALILYVVGLRFYVITKIRPRPFRVDDALIILSVAAMLALEGPTFWAIHNGLGARTATLEWSHVAVQIKLKVSAFWTWTISTCACKISLLYLYLKLFQLKVVFARIVWALIALNIIYVIVFITFFMTQCKPVWAAWDQVLNPTNCRPSEIHEITSVAVNLFLDLAVVLVPIPVVSKLQMPLSKKIGITAIFSLGFGVIGIMSWRLYTTSHDSKPDLVYDLYILALQSHLELWLGIIAANLPTLGPLIGHISNMKFIQKLSSSSSSSAPLNGIRKFSLVTFGSWGRNPKKGYRDEFYLLEADEERTQKGTLTTRNTVVSVSAEGIEDRNAKP